MKRETKCMFLIIAPHIMKRETKCMFLIIAHTMKRETKCMFLITIAPHNEGGN